jgi:uncharacterized lipoprotein YmbA
MNTQTEVQVSLKHVKVAQQQSGTTDVAQTSQAQQNSQQQQLWKAQLSFK